MTKKELWERWANPQDWAEWGGKWEDLEQEELDFYDDLDAWHLDKQERELRETKDKLIEHMDKLKDEDPEKAWKLDPKDMQKQVQKQLKNLKSIKL